MAYTASNTSWVTNNLVTAEDMNRIENNIEASAKHPYVQANDFAASTVLSSTAWATLSSQVLTTATGRVRLIASVTIETTLITSYAMTFNVNSLNVATPNEIVEFTIRAGDFSCVGFEYIFSTTPNTALTCILQYKRVGANNGTLRNFNFIVQDI